MNVLIVFVLSYVIGALSMRLIKGNRALSAGDFFLAWGLGVGISSQIVFYEIVFLNRFDFWMNTLVHLILVGILLAITVIRYRRITLNFLSDRCSLPRFFIFLSPFIMLVFFVAMGKPHGDWDAWSLWNYRANFILRSGEYWMDIFVNGTQGNHPWLLPFYIAHGWGLIGQESFLLPLGIGVVFCIATLGVLFYDLLDRFNLKVAIYSIIFIMTVPAFIFLSTIQYSDILISYYSLAAVTCLLRAVRFDDVQYFFLSGLLFGFLAFCKDQGIVIALIFIFLFFMFQRYFLSARRHFFWLGILPALPAIVTVKYWMSLGQTENYAVQLEQLFDPQRWFLIAQFIWTNVFENVTVWGYFWVLFAVTCVLCFKQISRFENKIVFCFLGSYIFVFLLAYLVSVYEIVWCMGTTLNRNLFQVLPLTQLMLTSLFAQHLQQDQDMRKPGDSNLVVDH